MIISTLITLLIILAYCLLRLSDIGVNIKAGEALLVLFTALLFLATEQLVIGEERGTKEANRAYVAVHHAVVSPLVVGQPVTCTAAAKNFGKSPASNVKLKVKVYFSDEDRREGVNSGTGGSLIGELGSQTLAVTAGATLQNDIIKYNAGLESVICEGEITYEDAFEELHVTLYKVKQTLAGLTFADDGNSVH